MPFAAPQVEWSTPHGGVCKGAPTGDRSACPGPWAGGVTGSNRGFTGGSCPVHHPLGSVGRSWLPPLTPDGRRAMTGRPPWNAVRCPRGVRRTWASCAGDAGGPRTTTPLPSNRSHTRRIAAPARGGLARPFVAFPGERSAMSTVTGFTTEDWFQTVCNIDGRDRPRPLHKVHTVRPPASYRPTCPRRSCRWFERRSSIPATVSTPGPGWPSGDGSRSTAGASTA